MKNFEHHEELFELHNDYPLALNNIEKKFSSYHLEIADLYNSSVGNVKQFVPYVFDKKEMCSIRRTCNLFENKIKAKKNTTCDKIR